MCVLPVVYRMLTAKHRNPLDIKNYNTIKRGKWLVTHTYTFTNEDYEIAKQQKKNS